MTVHNRFRGTPRLVTVHEDRDENENKFKDACVQTFPERINYGYPGIMRQPLGPPLGPSLCPPFGSPSVPPFSPGAGFGWHPSKPRACPGTVPPPIVRQGGFPCHSDNPQAVMPLMPTRNHVQDFTQNGSMWTPRSLPCSQNVMRADPEEPELPAPDMLRRAGKAGGERGGGKGGEGRPLKH